MSEEPNWEEISEDKEVKKLAVTEYIASKCTADSDIEDLRNISACLSNGSKLEIEILTGGLINYSYKISCNDPTNSVEHKIFAKLSFPEGMLFPGKACPLSRTENEYRIMKTFHKLAPGSVAIPYFCDDIGKDMKLLVTQWSQADEQFGNQFIDGAVDLRTATKIAEGISALHASTDHTLDFNSDVRPFIQSLVTIFKEIIAGLHKPENTDRVAVLAQKIGESATTEMVEAYIKSLDEAECLMHGDLHVFNILAGAKPDVSALESFEETGKVNICDWEMSIGGIAGKDMGTIRSFPISCVFAHAFNGHQDAAENCLDWLDNLWSTYENAIRKSGKSQAQVTKIFRQSLQYTALYNLCYYGINVHMEYLPIDDDNNLNTVKDSIGLVGLKFLGWGMDTDLSLEELKGNYKGAIEAEMTQLLKMKRVRRNRRSSMLRASDRRVSDANLHFANLDRMSFASERANSARLLSKLEDISVRGVSDSMSMAQ